MRPDQFEFYSALGTTARVWFDGGAEPALDYWSITLQTQPIELDPR